jgi:hypothetical protein
MKPHLSKLNEHQKDQSQHRHQSASETQVIEFASPEEALRFDLKQTIVPSRVAERLRESIRHETKAVPWWRRLLS